MTIFKIFQPHEWLQIVQTQRFKGSADDLRDGFIHLSAADQLAGTLEKYYADFPHIIIASVESQNWGSHLKWELSRGGASFPHLYTDLLMRDVTQYWELSKARATMWDLSVIEADLKMVFAPSDI